MLRDQQNKVLANIKQRVY